MSFKYVEYEVLKTKALQSVRSLFSHYGYHIVDKLIDDYKNNNQNIKEIAEIFSNTPLHRRTQSEVLLTVIGCLDASKKKKIDKKTEVLNAASWYIRLLIIAESSDSYIMSLFTSENNSNFFILLTSALNISSDNSPSVEQQLKMYKSLVNFLKSKTYKDFKNISNGMLPIEQQAFSEQKIEQFQVEDVIEDLNQRIIKCEKLQRGEVRTNHSIQASQCIGMFTQPKEKISELSDKESLELFNTTLESSTPLINS